MMLRLLAFGFGSLTIGVGLGVALWLVGPGEGARPEEKEWIVPAHPRSGTTSTLDLVDKLAGFPVFGIATPAAANGDSPVEATAPERFPRILSIAVLNGKFRAFFLSDAGERTSLGVGDEIVGWQIKAISMKGVVVKNESNETLLRPFEQIDIPTAPD